MIYTLVRRDSKNNINAVISFDSISAMDESWSATVTSQTVENGFDISDNINIESPSYSIEAVISSYSLFDLNKEIVWDGESFSNKSSGDEKSHVEARDAIIKIFSERSLLTLIESTANSNSKDYETAYLEITSGYFNEISNCVISSLSISHPSQGEGAFYVSLKIQKIDVADILTGELSKSEMIPALAPYTQDVANAPSGVSESKKEDGSDVAGQPTDLDSEAVAADKASRTGGISFAEGVAQANRDKAPLLYELKMVHRAVDMAALGRAQVLKYVGDTLMMQDYAR